MLLLGGTGMLGTRIKELLSYKYTIHSPSRDTFDLLHPNRVESLLVNTDIIVYAAGVTNQDIAEENQDLSIALNAKTPGKIARSAAKQKIPFVYFSTDAVFKGKQKKPYSETDLISPINFYGKSKRAGEEQVMNAFSGNVIIRLISVYSASYPTKVDFARKLYSKLSTNTPVVGIIDQYFNPAFSDTVVTGLDGILEKSLTGIYHLGATDCISNFEFVKLLAKIAKLNETLIQPTSFDNFFANKAARGQYCCLDTSKIQKILPGVLQSNKQNLTIFINQIHSTHEQ